MIEIRPLNPVKAIGDPDTIIASFNDSEWRNLIDLMRRYGFELPDEQIYDLGTYDHPIEIDVETSQRLYEAVSAVHNDETAPYADIVEESNLGKPPHLIMSVSSASSWCNS